MKSKINLLFKTTKNIVKTMREIKYYGYVAHVVLIIIETTIPFLLLYIFNLLLNSLSGTNYAISPITIAIIYACFLLIVPIISITHNLITNKGNQLLAHKIDINLAKQVESVELFFLDSIEGQNILDEFDLMKRALYNFFNKMLNLLSQIYTFIIAFVAIMVFNWYLGLLLLILTVPFCILNITFNKRTETFRIEHAPDVRKFSYYKWMLTDRITAKDVRMYDLSKPILDRYNVEKKAYLKANKELDLWKLIRGVPVTLLKYSGEIIFLLFLIFQTINNNLSIGELVLYSGLSLSLIVAFDVFVNSLGDIFEYDLNHIKSYDVFLNNIPRVDEDDKIEIEHFESISFNNVFFRYPTSDVDVLKGVSFTFVKGEKLSLIGINGAGKTTLLKLIMRFYPVSSGEILINNIPIDKYNIYSIRKLFGTLFQTYSRFNISLRENIALSKIENMDNDEKIIKAITKANATEILNKCDNNIDTYLGREFDDNGIELSTGQWQKVALARAYFKNAPILIFDEPSASLDAIAEDAIFQQIDDLSADKSCIMISHRISFCNTTNKIIVLDNGIIAEEGSHDELIAKNGIYSQIYTLQKERYKQEGE